MPVNHTIKLRRDTAEQWSWVNPRLKAGEPGFEIDTGRLKIGNGTDVWADLPYIGGSVGPGGDPTDLLAHINDPTPHSVYDDGPSLVLIYENVKV